VAGADDEARSVVAGIGDPPALKQLDLKQELASTTGDEYKFARV
jgi:hypothetical protein